MTTERTRMGKRKQQESCTNEWVTIASTPKKSRATEKESTPQKPKASENDSTPKKTTPRRISSRNSQSSPLNYRQLHEIGTKVQKSPKRLIADITSSKNIQKCSPSRKSTLNKSLDSTPTKMRVSEKRSTPQKCNMSENESTPKKTFSNKESTPQKIITRNSESSPLRTRQLNKIEASPMIATKSFYGGVKTSNVDKMKQVSPNPSTKVVSKFIPSSKYTYSDKALSPNSRIHEKMLEKIENSPVKQALLRTCSVEQFRRMFKDEFKALEREVELECRPKTRRISRIICSQDEDEDLNEMEDSEDNDNDGETSFKVNGGLDSDDVIEGTQEDDKRKSTVEFDMETSDEEGENSNDLFMEDTKESPKPKSEHVKEASDIKPLPSSNECKSNTPSSQKKFFKTRNPLDSVKNHSVVFGKNFSMKFGPKPQNLRHAKKKSSNKKTLQKTSQDVQKNKTSSLNEDVKQMTKSGFTFEPGFGSPKIDSSKDLVSENKILCDNGEQLPLSESLVLNRGEKTYDTSPQNKNTFEREVELVCMPKARISRIICSQDDEEDFNKMEDFNEMEDREDNDHESLVLNKGQKTYNNSPQDKNTFKSKLDDSPSADSVDLLEEGRVSPPSCQGTPVCNGSEDLFSTQSSNDTVALLSSSGSSSRRLFSIFNKSSPAQGTPSPRASPLTEKLTGKKITSPEENQTQYILDAGQKKFGATQCPVCGMVYCHADMMDEAAHARFHKRLLDVLKFPGWKNEHVAQEFPMDMARVIIVLPDAPKYARKKVEDLNQLMGRELGFPDEARTFLHPYHRVFIYISDKKQIEGCCVAEPINEGFRVIPDNLDDKEASGQRPWCCSTVAEPACVGINRLWVAASKRRSGVASKLVDCVTQWFEYGVLIPKHKLAFSDPTPDGRRFAQKYMCTERFLVYKYRS